jgi:hypothetical protein
MFHNICRSYPRVTKLSDKRKKAISARLKTYSVEDIKTAFEKAERSSFLKGRNRRNWSATFDWIMSDSNMAKILDGNYDDRPQQVQAPPAEQVKLQNPPPSPPSSNFDVRIWEDMAMNFDPDMISG